MNGTSFHVTLPSNSNLETCPNNKPSEYTVHLKTPVRLEGDWEVKLNNITIPYNWKTAVFNCTLHCAYLPNSSTRGHSEGTALNVRLDEAKRFTIEVSANQWGNTTCKTNKFAFNHTYSDNAKALGDEVAHRVNVALDLSSVVKFNFDKETGTGQFVADNGGLIFIYIQGSSKLAKYLGCRHAKATVNIVGSEDRDDTPPFWLITESGPVVLSNFVALDQIYVYSDIVKHQMVGDAEAPLLATFAMPKKSIGEKHHHEFLNERYLPINSKNFQRISVRLTTGKGINVPFAAWSSEVTIDLHFRKRI